MMSENNKSKLLWITAHHKNNKQKTSFDYFLAMFST